MSPKPKRSRLAAGKSLLYPIFGEEIGKKDIKKYRKQYMVTSDFCRKLVKIEKEQLLRSLGLLVKKSL